MAEIREKYDRLVSETNTVPDIPLAVTEKREKYDRLVSETNTVPDIPLAVTEKRVNVLGEIHKIIASPKIVSGYTRLESARLSSAANYNISQGIVIASQAFLLSKVIKLGVLSGFRPRDLIFSRKEGLAEERLTRVRLKSSLDRLANDIEIADATSNSGLKNPILNPDRYKDITSRSVNTSGDHSIYIVPIDNPGSKIRLDSIPKFIDYQSESAFAVIRSMGRNHPIYQFTGAEDKIEFEISWYSKSRDIDEVVRNCRRVEALSKADGYVGAPPIVMLHWHNTKRLFAEHYFIVISAPYKLANFSGASWDKSADRRPGLSPGVTLGIRDMELMPVKATQVITLARIASNNLLHEDIIRVGSKVS